MDAFAAPLQARKVLVVEDEPTLAENIGTYLEAMGYEARVVGDGSSAIALCNSFAADLLVLDYSLPDMSGFEVLDAMRRCSCQCECVLITAHPGETVRHEANRRGVLHILFKPFALRDLAVLARSVLQGRR